MIAHLRGILEYIGPDYIVADVGGVGYKVYIPLSARAHLPPVGEKIKLYTVTHVREDAITLYGFLEAEQQVLFERLLTVNGVGPRAALTLISTLSPRELLEAVATGEASCLQKAPGIGFKTAQRIVLELRDRLKDLAPPITEGRPAPPSDILNSAVEALISLGFTRAEARSAVERVLRQGGNLSDLTFVIQTALKELTKV